MFKGAQKILVTLVATEDIEKPVQKSKDVG
jgi:hypothetical protein